MIAQPPVSNRFDHAKIERGLDAAEDVFRRVWRKLITRYLTSIRVQDLEGSLAVPPLIEAELRHAVRELAKVMAEFGRRQMNSELGRARFAHSVFPEDPFQADLLIDNLLRDIPIEANRIVKDVLVDGSGDLREAMNRLSREFPPWTKPKLERIGRTVASFYFNRGRLDIMREAGVSLYEISAILDSRICAVCMPLDGLVFDINDELDVWPPYHWSCRCMAVAMLEHDGPVIRTYEQLQQAANRRLRDAGFMLGKKQITEWPGIEPGWGTSPVARQSAPALQREIEQIVGLGTTDTIALGSIVDGLLLLGGGAAISAAAASARYRRVKRLIRANRLSIDLDELIEQLRKRYNLNRRMAVMAAATYVETMLKRGRM